MICEYILCLCEEQTNLLKLLLISITNTYRKWKDQTLAYYSGNQMTYEEPEELDPEIRMQKRKEYLQHIFDEQEE